MKSFLDFRNRNKKNYHEPPLKKKIKRVVAKGARWGEFEDFSNRFSLDEVPDSLSYLFDNRLSDVSDD